MNGRSVRSIISEGCLDYLVTPILLGYYFYILISTNKAYSDFNQWGQSAKIVEAARALYGNINKLELYVCSSAESAFLNPDIPILAWPSRGESSEWSWFLPWRDNGWVLTSCHEHTSLTDDQQTRALIYDLVRFSVLTSFKIDK